MPDVDAILQPPAREFYDHVATRDERRQIDAIIVRLCATPGIDYATRFPFGLGRGQSGQGIMYNDGRFWLTYRRLNARGRSKCLASAP